LGEDLKPVAAAGGCVQARPLDSNAADLRAGVRGGEPVHGPDARRDLWFSPYRDQRFALLSVLAIRPEIDDVRESQKFVS
jgi:hypothetical protein